VPMSIVRSTLMLTCMVLVGCGGSDPGPATTSQPETTSDPDRTIEVAAVTPNFEWSIEQLLVGYFEAESREAQQPFEVDVDSEQRVGPYPFGLNAGEYRIQPNVVTRLHPGMSAEFYVDLPDASSTPFIVVRTENGYRINVDRTNHLRDQLADEQFQRDNGLSDAKLVVKLLGLSKTDLDSYEAQLQIINDSRATIESFEISMLAESQSGEKESTTVSGGELASRAGEHFVAEFQTLPASNVRIEFRLLKLNVTLTTGESFDATSYFRVSKPRGQR